MVSLYRYDSKIILALPIEVLLVSLMLAEIHKHCSESPFKVDLRSSKIDILLTCTRIYVEQGGSSAGVLWALGLL